MGGTRGKIYVFRLFMVKPIVGRRLEDQGLHGGLHTTDWGNLFQRVALWFAVVTTVMNIQVS